MNEAQIIAATKKKASRPDAATTVLPVIAEHFPAIVAEVDICLSVAATLHLSDQVNPVALNLEGVPSSSKTTIIDFLREAGDDKVYLSDKFTAKSFVSHSASISSKRLDDVDLLPRIRHKLFLVPELAPLFAARNEDLLDNFAILTRVLDGRGLLTDSGVHGRRGHSGDYLFCWIGATTPIEYRVWRAMGKLGSRFLFVEMPDSGESDASLADDASASVSYADRVAICQRAVTEYLDELWASTGGVRGIEWQRDGDPREIMLKIAAYARVLARLRGTIAVWREGAGDEETYNFSTPVVEKANRAMSLLYGLGRGHAIVHGRRQLDASDLGIVARVALESVPNDRRRVMRIVLAKGGVIETSDVEAALACSAPTARAILETLDKLRLGIFDNPGAPTAATFTLADQFEWLLEEPGL